MKAIAESNQAMLDETKRMARQREQMHWAGFIVTVLMLIWLAFQYLSV